MQRNGAKNRIFKTALSHVVHTTDTIINKEYTTMAQQPTLTTDEALVLQQINEHGGKINVDSTPGIGTTFTVALRLAGRQSTR